MFYTNMFIINKYKMLRKLIFYLEIAQADGHANNNANNNPEVNPAPLQIPNNDNVVNGQENPPRRNTKKKCFT